MFDLSKLNSYRVTDDMLHYLDDMEPMSDFEKQTIWIERFVLSMKPGTTTVERWSDVTKEMVREYLTRRITKTENKHLLLRYKLHLFYLKKDDYKVLKEAISDGVEVLKKLTECDTLRSTDTFCRWFEIVYPLSRKTKQDGLLKNVLTEALYRGEEIVRIFALFMIYNSDTVSRDANARLDVPLPSPFKLGKLFKAEDLSQLALDLLQSSELRNVRRMLESAVFYAEKSGNKELKAKSNDMFGDFFLGELKPDNPKNLAIAPNNDMNLRSALSCFKRSGNKEKQDKAYKLYEENKTKIKYFHITHSIPIEKRNADIEQINSISAHIASGGINAIMGLLLGFGINIFGKSADEIGTWAKECEEQNLYQRLSADEVVDPFGNSKSTSFTRTNTFQFIDAMFRNYTYHVFSLAIMNGLKQGTLTYDILADKLSGLGFSLRTEKTIDGQTYGCTYLERVNIGLREFLQQNELMMNNQPTDWRSCIPYLTTQFEGLLRDIVMKLGGQTTKIKRDTDTELILLEPLLNSDCLTKVFDADDLLLFRETFTNSGYNIRNNVAHGLYLPDEYTPTKALLVFVSVVRLAKATMALKDKG